MLKDCKAFIFDWSGTISDDRLPIYQANMKVWHHLGIAEITPEEWLKDTKTNIFEHLAQFGVEHNIPFIKKLFNDSYIEECENGTCPFAYKDAQETLKTLKEKGKRLGIVSSHPLERIEEEIKKYNLENIFDEVIGWAGEKRAELISMCEKLNIKREEACYVGDMIFDVRSAKAAGLISIAITHGYHDKERLEKEKPDFLIDSLSELTNFI